MSMGMIDAEYKRILRDQGQEAADEFAHGMIGGSIGLASGGLTGAAIGSVVPVVGTAVGAVVGGVIGTFCGVQDKTARDNAWRAARAVPRFLGYFGN